MNFRFAKAIEHHSSGSYRRFSSVVLAVFGIVSFAPGASTSPTGGSAGDCTGRPIHADSLSIVLSLERHAPDKHRGGDATFRYLVRSDAGYHGVRLDSRYLFLEVFRNGLRIPPSTFDSRSGTADIGTEFDLPAGGRVGRSFRLSCVQAGFEPSAFCAQSFSIKQHGDYAIRLVYEPPSPPTVPPSTRIRVCSTAILLHVAASDRSQT